MNAPFIDPRPDRLTPDELDRIARNHRRGERQRRKLLGSCRTTDTGLLLRRLKCARVRELADAMRTMSVSNFEAPSAVAASTAAGRSRLGLPKVSLSIPRRAKQLVAAMAVIGGLLALGPRLVEQVASPAIGSIDNGMVTRVERELTCRETVRLLTETGKTAGLFRREASDDCHSADLSARFDDATALWVADAIGALEGEWRAGFSAPFGQDLKGLVKGALFGSGSGPILSAFEQLAGNANAIRNKGQKARNVLASAIFTARYLRDDLARAHFITSGMTVYHPHGRAKLAGALAADVLFGGAPDTLAEVCLFAAASGFFLRQPLPSAPADWNDLAQSRMKKARGRAAACARKLSNDQSELATALEELAAFRAPVAAPPTTGGDLLMLIEDSLASGEPPKTERPVVTSLATARMTEGRARVDAALAAIAPRLATGLCVQGCRRELEHLVAVAEIKGDALLLRAAYSNRHHRLFGPPDQDGVPQPPTYGLASLHKSLLALVATRNGEERLCNRASGNIRNSRGPESVVECVKGAATGWVTTEQAMAISMNLPFIDLAARRMAEVGALERALGFLGDPAGPAGATLGTGRRAPPERMMALMAAMDRAAWGEPARTDGLSMFVESEGAYPIDLAAIGYARDDAAKAAVLLTAPLGKGGTLESLSPAMQAIGCRALRGKTGSPEIEDSRARARLAAATVDCGERRFVVYAQLDSGRGDTPLGQITARDLAALIAAAIAGTALNR